jgi:hypothetical protein
MDTFIAVVILLLTSEIWVPLAVLWGFANLVFTLSIGATWMAAKSIPLWIWDFVHSWF